MAGLARMANRDHRFVEIQPGDTVIVSASPIPGNEEYVARTIDNLFKAGANVYYHTIKRAHVSGHASQEELKLMLGLTKPKHFIPIHGEFRMQVQHGRLAIETGVAPENVFIIENGTPIEICADGSARRGQPVPAGYVFVDGLSVGEVGEIVLRDRRALANDGMFMVVVTVDKQTGNVVGRPEIITRGFVHLQRAGPDHGRGDRAGHRRRSRTRATTSARSRCSRARSRTACRATCTSRRSAGRWSSRSWWRSEWPTRRRTTTPPRRAARARPSIRLPRRRAREVARSIVGIVLLVLGAVTLIALALPGQGALTDWWRDSIAPWFETGRWLLPFLLLGAGWYVEWGPGKAPGSGWGMTLARDRRSPTSASWARSRSST